MIPPVFILVNVQNPVGKSVKLWLPFILLWPFYLGLLLLLFPFALIAELILVTTGIRPLSIILAIVSLIGSVKGLSVKVHSKNYNNSVNVMII